MATKKRRPGTPKRQPPRLLSDSSNVRTIEVHAEIPDSHGTRLSASWERWDGRGTADSDYPPPEGTLPRPDYELRLGILGLSDNVSWATGGINSEKCGTLSGTDLDLRVIRGYALLLDQLADRVEVAAEAEAAYYREHDRAMRRRTLKRA